ncbi:MAG: serine/threonine-protein kinase [Gemmataceae bacterium]|nr:serine/threonine-protein kinase [Gemmataceae bacterium]
MTAAASPDFLVADLAVARGFASREEVFGLFAQWLAAPDGPFLRRLAAARLLSAADHDLLGTLAYEQLRRGGRPTDGLGWEPPADDSAPPAASTPPPAATLPVAPERQVEQFRIVREHARGGLGRVSVALDERLGREVAFKEIRGEYEHRDDLRARFLREAAVTGRLEHPGIVPVYALGEHADGRPYYAMRFVEGRTLADAVAEFHAAGGRFDSLEFRQLLGRFTAVCEAIAYAHSRGVIHRDLKPANVMLGQYGETLVVDWGLAKVLGQPDATATDPTLAPLASTDTVAGATLGTPAFMSPEQAAGRIADLGPATDIYSLGAVLYVVLTGRTPIETAEGELAVEMARFGETMPVELVKPNVPAALSAICRRAMAVRPEERYDTVAALSADIERWLADAPVDAYEEPISASAGRWARKNPALITGFVSAFVVGASLAGVWTAFVGGERVRAQALREESRQLHRDANAVLEFIAKRVFHAPRLPGSGGGLGRDVKLYEALDQALRSAINDYANQPRVAALLSESMGELQLALGEPARAVTQYTRALELSEAQFGLDHDAAIRCRKGLEYGLFELGAYEQVAYSAQTTLRKCRVKYGDFDITTLASMAILAGAYANLGKADAAICLSDEAKVIYAQTGKNLADDIEIDLLNSIAYIHSAANRYDASIPLWQELVHRCRRKYDDDDPSTLAARQCLAYDYAEIGRTNEALLEFEQTVPKLIRLLGPDHFQSLNASTCMAGCMLDAGRPEDAMRLVEDVIGRIKIKREYYRPLTPFAMIVRGIIHGRRKDLDRCREDGLVVESLNPKHPSACFGLACLWATVAFHPQSDDADKAVAWLEKAVAAGFKDVTKLKNDNDLAPLRHRPDFRALVAELEAKYPRAAPKKE